MRVRSHMLPKVFIVSSTENLKVASKVAAKLKKHAVPLLWKDFFTERPGFNYLTTLLHAVQGSDYAVFVLIGEDETRVRGKARKLPRDNVVFELGLFASRIGPERCFVISNSGTHKLTDMEGRNFIAIEDQPKGSQGAINFVESIDNACRSIATVMTKGPDPIKPINPETRCAVNRVLRLTMELFSSVSKKPIGANFRAYCHLYYHSGHKLLPLTSVGESTFDRDAEIPCDVGTTTTWWIISRAFHKREWECADVDWANMPKDASASLVSKELNAVFAFPIRLASQDSKVLGTIDINSNKTTKDLGWPKPSKLEEFGREGAAAVYHILNHNLPTP